MAQLASRRRSVWQEVSLDSLRLINIRSFTDSESIKIAPLTVLVGQNSSGKSTFARMFPLLRQTSESLTREPLLWFGRLVDFRSLEESKSKFAETGETGITFEFQMDQQTIARRRRGLVQRAMTPSVTTGVKVSIRYLSGTNQRSAYAFSYSFLGYEIALEIQDSFVSILRINGTDYSHFLSNAGMIAATWSSCFPNLAFREGNTYSSEGNIFARHLQAFVRSHTHGKSGPGRVEQLTRGLISSTIDDLLVAVKTVSSSDSMWQRTTNYWTAEHPDYKRVRDLIIGARAIELIDQSATAFRAMCNRIRYITPIRASAERYYRQRGLALGEIDPQGQNVAMFLHNMSSMERQRFASWMSEFFGVYVGTEVSQGHISMVIRGEDSAKDGPSFNLADTGFGFSQMIPILIQVWITSSSRIQGQFATQIISIEQPELHLHPRLQAKLADLLLQAISASRKSGVDLRIVLETHSEQIINRIGKRVSEGTFEGSDVCVVLFEKADLSHATKVTQTSYDREGLLEVWPYGFFESDDK